MIYTDFGEQGSDVGQPAMEEGEQPQVFQIRGHLVHGIPRVGDSNYDPACPTCNPGSINDLGTPTAVVVTTSSPPAAMATAVAIPDPIPATDDYNYYGQQQDNGSSALIRQYGVNIIKKKKNYALLNAIICLYYYLPIRNHLSLRARMISDLPYDIYSM